MAKFKMSNIGNLLKPVAGVLGLGAAGALLAPVAGDAVSNMMNMMMLMGGAVVLVMIVKKK